MDQYGSRRICRDDWGKFLSTYHSMASNGGHAADLKQLSNPNPWKNLKIPNDLCKAMSTELQTQIDELRKTIRAEMNKSTLKSSSGTKPTHPATPTTSTPLPHQYPTKTKANQVTSNKDKDEIAPSYGDSYDKDNDAMEEG